MTALAPLLLAVALLVLPTRTARTRLAAAVPVGGKRPLTELGTASSWRVPAAATGALLVLLALGVFASWGLAVVVLAALAALWWYRHSARRERPGQTEPLALAAGWDLLSAGLRAGLPVPVAVWSVAEELPGTTGDTLRKVADLLALGADQVAAWEQALSHPETAELARAARRTARTGSGLALMAEDLAVETRAAAADHAQERAQRAAVWVTAPLGGCFLPAFLCLGVLPVVAGMTRQLPIPW